MKLEEPGLIRVMTAMAGGTAAKGGPCGALTGGVALLGRCLGREKPEDKDDPRLWKACHVYYQRFSEEVAGKHGSVNCRDITGVDWSDREQSRAFYQGEGVQECIRNTGNAARILGEVLEKYVA